jgi:CO/xanthine dehydrogenase FAD-binding subunit
MRTEQGALQVGAAVTQAALEWRPRLAQELPLLQCGKIKQPCMHFRKLGTKNSVMD